MKSETLIKIDGIVTIPQFVVMKKLNEVPFDSKYYAVRSSASDEDTSEASKAGMYNTFLFVEKEDLPEVITKVITECGTAIVQEMINSDFSGVVLIDKEPRVFVAQGLCEGITSGKVMTDEYLIKDNEFKKVLSIFEEEPFGAFYKNGEIVIEKAEELILSNHYKEEILKMIKELKRVFKHPIDVEFTFNEGILYCLQCRPLITSPL